MNRVRNWSLLATMSVVVFVSIAQPQARSNRASHPDAPMMEYLIDKLYPGWQYRWNPDLEIQDSEGNWHEFAMHESFKLKPDGTLWGVINYGIDGWPLIKAIQSLEGGIAPTAPKQFPRHMVAFRRGVKNDNVISFDDMKKFDLDPGDGTLFVITDMSIPAETKNATAPWPMLSLAYRQYFIDNTGVPLYIEFKGNYDTNTARFVSRVPTGPMIRFPGGEERLYGITFTRTSLSELTVEVQPDIEEIKSAKLPIRKFTYPCSDPCLWQPRMLLERWENAPITWVPVDLPTELR